MNRSLFDELTREQQGCTSRTSDASSLMRPCGVDGLQLSTSRRDSAFGRCKCEPCPHLMAINKWATHQTQPETYLIAKQVDEGWFRIIEAGRELCFIDLYVAQYCALDKLQQLSVAGHLVLYCRCLVVHSSLIISRESPNATKQSCQVWNLPYFVCPQTMRCMLAPTPAADSRL